MKFTTDVSCSQVLHFILTTYTTIIRSVGRGYTLLCAIFWDSDVKPNYWLVEACHPRPLRDLIQKHFPIEIPTKFTYAASCFGQQSGDRSSLGLSRF